MVTIINKGKKATTLFGTPKAVHEDHKGGQKTLGNIQIEPFLYDTYCNQSEFLLNTYWHNSHWIIDRDVALAH